MSKNELLFDKKEIGIFILALLLAIAVAVCLVFLPVIYSMAIFSALLLVYIPLFIKPRFFPYFICIIFIAVMYINLIKIFTEFRYTPIIFDAAIFLFLSTILIYLITSHGRIGYDIAELLVLLFLGTSVIQIFNPNVPSLIAGFEGFRKTSYHMLMILLGIYAVRSVADIDKILRALCWASVPVLLYGIKQHFFFSSFDERIITLNYAGTDTYHILGDMRAMSIFSGPFHFGMFSGVILMLSFFLFYQTNSKKYLILISLSVLSIFLSITRTNIIAALIALLFATTFYANKKQFRLIFTLLLFAIFTGAILLMIFSPLFHKLEADQRLLARFTSWNISWRSFLQNPIIGYGMGSSGDTLLQLYNYKTHITAHNLFLKILHETGLIGLLVYFAIFVAYFKTAYQLLREPRFKRLRSYTVCLISVALILLVNAMFGSTVEAYPVNVYIWFFIGALFKVKFLEAPANG